MSMTCRAADVLPCVGFAKSNKSPYSTKISQGFDVARCPGRQRSCMETDQFVEWTFFVDDVHDFESCHKVTITVLSWTSMLEARGPRGRNGG